MNKMQYELESIDRLEAEIHRALTQELGYSLWERTQLWWQRRRLRQLRQRFLRIGGSHG